MATVTATNTEFVEFLRKYRSYQDRAIEILTVEGVEITANGYAAECAENEHLTKTRKYFPHGAGFCLEIDGIEIEVDFGPNGLCNSFDAWRVYCFADATNYKFNDMELIQRLLESEPSLIQVRPGMYQFADELGVYLDEYEA